MNPTKSSLILFFIFVALIALGYWNNTHQEEFPKEPREPLGAILHKPATYEQYRQAEHPCPGYPKPVIVPGTQGDELGDCDGDEYVDEVTYGLPTAGILPPERKQWIFVFRPGVAKIMFKDGSPPTSFSFGFCPATAVCSSDWQETFKESRSKNPPTKPADKGRLQ